MLIDKQMLIRRFFCLPLSMYGTKNMTRPMNPQRITIFYNPFACTVLLLLPLATKMPSCNAARPPHGGQRGRRDHKHKTIAPSCKHAPQRSKDPQRYTIANAHCVDGVDLIQLTAVPSANALRSKNLCLALWRMEGGRMRLLCVVFRALITSSILTRWFNRVHYSHISLTLAAQPRELMDECLAIVADRRLVMSATSDVDARTPHVEHNSGECAAVRAA